MSRGMRTSEIRLGRRPGARARCEKRRLGVLVLLAMLSLQGALVHSETAPQMLAAVTGTTGDGVDALVINGPPMPPPGYTRATVDLPEPDSSRGVNTLPDVPAFDWSFGCSATSAAMMAGYYDRTGYPNAYSGPANGGVCPLDNSGWPDWVDGGGDTRSQCPLSATHQGLDGRVTRGHVDDYWTRYGDPGPDPFVGHWAEHVSGDCTADFMRTNQSAYGNIDGATRIFFYASGAPCSSTQDGDGAYGLKRFFDSRGYAVSRWFNQLIRGSGADPLLGFTFDQYKGEVDAGRPVMIHVANSDVGHSMVGVGYDSAAQLIYLHDTWDYSTHTMVWGGVYSGMRQWGVTVLELAAPSCSIAVTSPAGGGSLEGGATHTITWTGQDAGSNVKIEYSTNGGLSWTTIIASTANDGSYDWAVPNTWLANCFVRICATTDTQCCGASDPFSIDPTPCAGVATRTFDCAKVCPGDPTARVTVTIVPDRAYSGFALDENPPAGWTITPVSTTGSPAYNATLNTWLWLSVTIGQTLEVKYDLTRNPSAPYGTYQVMGRVQSAAPALDEVVCEQTDIVWKADPCGCACCLEFLAAHWDGTTVNAGDPCQISTSQILAAISWWANPASGPAAVSGVVCPPSDWPISTTKILQMIALWSQSACVDDCTPPWTGRTSAAERVGANATRAINPDTVARGGTVRVAVTINVTEAVTGLALDENPPTGWTLTPVSATGSPAYNPTLQTWLWLNAAIGQLTVEYDLTVPGDACCCAHAFTGSVESALPVFNNAVGGEMQVTVAGPGCELCWALGRVAVTASGSGVAVAVATFGVDAGANNCLDDLDELLSPAPSGDYTAAWFELPTGCGASPDLSDDIRAPVTCPETQQWAMRVCDTGSDGTVTLRWAAPAITAGVTQCVDHVSATLYDTVSGVTVDMQTVGTYTYAKAANPDTRSFVIAVDCLPSSCAEEETVLDATGWHMISIPGELCAPCTVWQGECGDLVCALSDDLDPFFAYRYDASLGTYVSIPPTEQICHHHGMGFWVCTYDHDVAIGAEVLPEAGNVWVSLQGGWNQMGNPYAFAVGAGSIRVECGGQGLPLIDAQAQGWISATLYGYDTVAGAYVEIDPATGCIPAWVGFWIRTYRDDCTIVFQPAGCAANATEARRLGVAEVRALELPPLPPLDPQGEDIAQALTEISVSSEPNPVRSENTTVFRVSGTKSVLVDAMRVDIYDLNGARVFTQEIAAQELAWHTVNDAGELLANGVYLYQAWVRIGEIWYPMEFQKVAVVR